MPRWSASVTMFGRVDGGMSSRFVTMLTTEAVPTRIIETIDQGIREPGRATGRPVQGLRLRPAGFSP